MTPVSELIDRAAVQLHDLGGEDFTALELLDYLNEGLQRMVELRPDLFTVSEPLELVPGTRQRLPRGGAAFLRVERALQADGTPGRVAVAFDLESMDLADPNWHVAAPGPVRGFSGDPHDPRTFWVSPPSDGGQAEVVYVKAPPVLELHDEVPVGSRFDQALIDYILFRAYSKDTDYAGQDGRAGGHYQAYERGVNGGSTGSTG